MTAYETAVLADSPRGYWKLGDTSGTTVVDSSGNAHDGTYGAGVTLNIPGGVNGSDPCVLNTQATNAFITVADHADFKPSTAISVEAWVQLVANNGNQRIVQKGTTDQGLRWYWDGSNLRAKFRISGTDRELTYAAPFSDKAWHHIVLTWASGNPVRLWFDKVNVVSSSNITGTLDTNTSALEWGSKAGTGGTASERWNGYMDEVAFYATELNSTSIASHYDNISVLAGGARVTEELAEVPVLGASRTVRITQELAEVAIVGTPQTVRVTQLLAEVVVEPYTPTAYWGVLTTI